MSDPGDLTNGTLDDDADLDSDSSLAEKVATADSMESSRSTETADNRQDGTTATTTDEIDRSERHD